MSKQIEYYNKIEELTFFVGNILANKSNEQRSSGDETRTFMFVLALKINNGLRTVNYLILHTPRQVEMFDSIFILLRTLLSDTITYYYLNSKVVNKPEDEQDKLLKEEIKILRSDHVKFVDSNFKIYKELYGDDDKHIGSMKSDIRNRYPDYFNEDGSTKYRSKNIGGMIIDIIESKKDYLISLVTKPYELYDTFSKYEHLGEFTLQLVTRHYYVEQHSEIYKQIFFAVKSSLLSLYSLITTIASKEELDNYEKLLDEIVAIKIYE